MYCNPFGPPRRRSYPGQRTTGCTPNANGRTRMSNGCTHSSNCCTPQQGNCTPANPAPKKESTCPARKEVCNNPPGKIHTEVQTIFLKHSSMGETVLPENTQKGVPIRIASINIDTFSYQNLAIHLNFSCNIIAIDACLHLEFQIFRQLVNQPAPVPVSTVFYYARDTRSTESNTLSFYSVDQDEPRSKCCNYSVYAKPIGFDTIGLTRITASGIACTISDNPGFNP